MKRAVRNNNYKTVEELYRDSQPSYANAGGFIVEEEEETTSKKSRNLVDDLASFLDDDDDDGGGGFFDEESEKPICNECKKSFIVSYLLDKFRHPVCDECKDLEEKHVLITRTEAKNEYLLKDCDLDGRQPMLKFICKKNPHNPRWGDMKLYLRSQIEQRAVEVWGSMEMLEEAKEKREDNRECLKQKRFQKKLKELRKQVRSDLYRKPAANHQHEYGEELKDEKDEDTFYKICIQCQHKLVYEKL